MTGIIEATKDIKPNLIFNNAGYMTTGVSGVLESLPAACYCLRVMWLLTDVQLLDVTRFRCRQGELELICCCWLSCTAAQLFASQSLQGILNNYNCNATAGLPITHHFVNKMLGNKQKGA
jgi:hypothetical protein